MPSWRRPPCAGSLGVTKGQNQDPVIPNGRVSSRSRASAPSVMEVGSVDVSFGTIWEAIARDQPDTLAISEPDRDYIVATPSGTLTEQELKNAVRRRLAGYKVPVRWCCSRPCRAPRPASWNWRGSAASPRETRRPAGSVLSPGSMSPPGRAAGPGQEYRPNTRDIAD